MTLKARFLFIFSCFIFLMLVVSSMASYVLERRSLLQSQRQQTMATLEKVALICQEAALKGDWSGAGNRIRAFVQDISVYSATCIDGRGRVRADSDASRRGSLIDPGEMAGIREQFSEKEYIGPEGRIYRRISRPIWVESRPVGVARAEFSALYLRRQLQHRLLETLQRMSFVCLITMAFAILAAFFVSNSLVRPIKELQFGARKIGKGEFKHRIAARRKDELGELAGEFNAMAAKLNELDALKDSFLSRVTHDLRNPLTAMLGYAEILLKTLKGDGMEVHLAQLRIIRASGIFLSELINNLLDVTKLEAGRMEFVKSSMDLRLLCESVVELMAVQAGGYKIQLDLSGIAPGTSVWADEAALRRVLLNLVSNAMKFTPAGGRVSLHCFKTASGQDQIEVRDTGIGIPSDKMGVLFTKFGQVEENQNKVRRATGTGLGLVICKEIIEAHGGKIGAASSLGQGTTFFFVIPPNHVAPKLAAARAAPGGSVLAVDDDPDNLSLVKCTLENFGYQVYTASDVAAACKIMMEVKPSLVVTDIHLPDRSGYDFCTEIKESPELKHIPVIMMTGTYHRGEDRLRALERGADAYLLKPFLAGELELAIRRVTARAHDKNPEPPT